MTERPFIIGVAGPSGSGKTALAESLAALLGNTEIVRCDDYYHDLTAIPVHDREKNNFDHPDAIDKDLLREHIKMLSEGRSVDSPVYDYSIHSRTSRVRRIDPQKVIILEGLFTLFWEEIRHYCVLSIFVEAAHDICLQRRIDRDMKERGFERGSIIQRYQSHVKPMCDLYVNPTMEFAQIILDGTKSIPENVKKIIRHVHLE